MRAQAHPTAVRLRPPNRPGLQDPGVVGSGNVTGFDRRPALRDQRGGTLSLLQVVLLGLVQGITEYLPISSSAHLVLLPRLAGWQDQGLVFDVAANTGTLLAVLLYFREDLVSYGRAVAERFRHPRSPLSNAEDHLLKLVVATVPVAVAGWLWRDWIADQARNPLLIAWTCIGFGILLGLADYFCPRRRDLNSVGWSDAALIGIAQAFALIPGTSRSGVTITAGRALGFDRDASARFSFMLAIPVGLLAGGRDAVALLTGGIPKDAIVPLLVVVAVSAVAGYLMIEGLLAWVRRQSLLVFVAYRIGLGLVLLWIYV